MSASVAPMLRSLPQPDATKGVEPAATPLKAILLNPLLDATWDTAVRNHPDATIFHSAAWARVLVDTYGHRPCYLQISLHGNLLALIPMMEVQTMLTKSRGICLPFSDYCAPLAFSSCA